MHNSYEDIHHLAYDMFSPVTVVYVVSLPRARVPHRPGLEFMNGALAARLRCSGELSGGT